MVLGGCIGRRSRASAECVLDPAPGSQAGWLVSKDCIMTTFERYRAYFVLVPLSLLPAQTELRVRFRTTTSIALIAIATAACGRGSSAPSPAPVQVTTPSPSTNRPPGAVWPDEGPATW